jgi:hypothetical protein
MTSIIKLEPERAPAARTVHKVKGPIRCHKCQLKCSDAEHYLSHACEPKPSPDCSPRTLESVQRLVSMEAAALKGKP